MVAPALIPGGAEAEAAEGLAHGAQAAEAAAEGGSALARAARGVGSAVRNSPAGLALKAGEHVSELAGRGLEGLGLTGESLLGKVARSGIKAAAGGAAEGAAFGAGGALSEAALAPDGDYDSLAQKLWSGAIHGAEFGAAIGGGLGAGGELLGAAARKIGGSFSAQKALRDLADTRTLKTAGYDAEEVAAMRRSDPERVHDIAEQARTEKSVEWTDTLPQRARKYEAAREEAANTLGTMRKGLDDARGPGEGVHVREVLDDAATRASQMVEEAHLPGQKKAAQNFADHIEFFQQKFRPGEPASFEAAHDFTEALDKELKRLRRSGGEPNADPFERELTRLRTDIHQQFETDAERVMGSKTPEFRDQYADLKARHSALDEITQASKARVEKAGKGELGSLSDTLAGIAGFASLGPKGILAAAARRAMRSTQADHIVGRLASEVADLTSNIDRSAARWGANSRRAARGATEGIGAHHTAFQHGLEKTGEAVKATTGSTLHVKKEAGEKGEHAKEYFEKLRAVEQESKAPLGTLVHIPDAPKTAAAAEAVRRREAAWLLKEAPKSPATIANPVLARMARQTPPTTVDALKWLRKVKTIEDPMSAVRAFEQGRLTTDHVRALEVGKPAVLQMIRNAVTQQITEHNADISYQSRIQVGVLTGVVTDPSLRPESIAAGQAIYQKRKAQQAPQKPEQPGQPQQSAPGKRPAGFDSALDQMESNTARI
jgi:hypothetical protein